MADDGLAAAEIAKQIAALRPRVEGARGVMAYLEKPPVDKRSDVNKTFLASTIRGVNSHNRRQEEDKCWTLRRMEQKLDEPRRTRSRDSRKRRRSPSRSRSRSSSRRRERDRSGSRQREERSSSRRSRRDDKKQEEDERSFWARKKAEKTRQLWENLHAEGTVSVENAPEFSAEESDDEDVKPRAASNCKEKKHRKHKKSRKGDKKGKRRRSRS